jgi:hypothetical protein
MTRHGVSDTFGSHAAAPARYYVTSNFELFWRKNIIPGIITHPGPGPGIYVTGSRESGTAAFADSSPLMIPDAGRRRDGARPGFSQSHGVTRADSTTVKCMIEK